ncbi:Zn-dependent M28 family amino/carboxypeptidase [Sphingomonas kaistensis]|uniref:Zn-dependent M28 family amino/carboxypeptidase n=1 Tax=Sphingomonas kaistensis TaxID=298708 RepID=A0A7X5Y8W5_9SPHN|nr:M28 family metallopeptidase [Sphingomonas kaistensis]NJC06055.1 Zn-dependent M28 family amino/carboxypeptidase [Sphingomonas kaistensis]
MTRFALLLAATTLAASPLAAQNFSIPRISQDIKTLSSDAYEGRGPATPGEVKTVAYLSQQLKAAGVQPGGDVVNGQRQYTQRVPLLQSNWTADPVVTLQGGTAAGRLAQGTDIAVRAPLNGASQLQLANAPLVFAGYGVQAPERQWDDFKGMDVRGKILVVFINDPDFDGPLADGGPDFGGKAMTYYGRWTYKYEQAAKLGAAGVLIVHEDAPASYGWATVKNSNTNTMFDVVRQQPGAAHPAMESWISSATAEKIFAASGTTLAQAKAAARRRDFKPVELPVRLNASGTATAQTITSYNVVGLLPGTTRPDETVIYSAHWDHLGVGLPDARGDRIYNGAADNATGTAHVLEQARQFAREPRTQRSLVFLFVTAEEKGLLGTEYYVSNPLYALGKTAGVLNTDGGSLYGPSRDFSISGSAKLGLLDLLTAEAAKQNRTYSPDERPEAGSFFRSDHFPFAKRGVPAISWNGGRDLVNGGKARAKALADDYTAKRYHQPADEFDPNWDFTGLVQDARILHAVGRNLANSTAWPNWSEDSEFRGARDASGAERGGPAPAAATTAAGERG